MATAALRDGLLTVPVVDISSFRMPYADADARHAVVRQVDEAVRTVGFMQVTGHGIPADTQQAFTAAMDAFFAPDPRPASTIVFHADAPGFTEAVEEWFRAAGTVARTMVKIFGAARGGDPGCIESLTDHSADVLRMNNYTLPGPGVWPEAGQFGMGAHTDYGIVTVLWADRVPGLEILGADGGWHPVQPAGRALLVNLGDALARWTNGEWISAVHRVAPPRVNGVLVPRRSAAFEVLASLPAISAARPPAGLIYVGPNHHDGRRRGLDLDTGAGRAGPTGPGR